MRFSVTISSIALQDQAGKQVSLYTNAKASNGGVDSGPAEFMHLNGTSEPLVNASVPQGTYTAATVKVAYCSFTAVSVNSSGGIVDSTYAEGVCGQGTGNATVNLPSPITISGSSTALSLNLQVPQSYTLNGTGAPAAYTISPVFTLSPVAISSQPTNEQMGKFAGIDAQITSVNAAAGSLMVQTSDGISLTVNSGNSTAYQGIAGFSALAAGMLVNLDLAIQRNDGSLLATRIEVNDATSRTLEDGTVVAPGSTASQFVPVVREGENCSLSGAPVCSSLFQYTSSTVFSTSGQFSNLANLPFPASFNGSSLFLGQNLSIFSVDNVNATTLVLTPQTVNGTVTAVSSSGAFNVYTVALAVDDPIPTLQQAVGPIINRLNSPNEVTVYADANTHLLNSGPISAGSVLRFRGLLFDDNGTLRMDCEQISDGVSQ